MQRIRAIAFAVALTLVAAAVAVLLWPLHANGVSGSALTPRYSHYFGISSAEPIPEHPTKADLRRAGVRLPQDVVTHRRHIALALVAAGLTLAAATAASSALRHRPDQEDRGTA